MNYRRLLRLVGDGRIEMKNAVAGCLRCFVTRSLFYGLASDHGECVCQLYFIYRRKILIHGVAEFVVGVRQ